MNYKRQALMCLLLGFLLILAGCITKDKDQKKTTILTEADLDSDVVTVIPSQDESTLDDTIDDDMIAEPGLELVGTVLSISDNTIIIETNNYYDFNHLATKEDEKEPSETIIEQTLSITNDTIIMMKEGETTTTINKKSIPIGAKVTYSFSIAYTGYPALYSITIIK